MSDIANADNRLRETVVDRVRQSVFGVYSDAQHSPDTFLGCAWKIAPRVWVTCWHIIGDVTEGPHGVRLPAGRLRAGTFFLRNGATQARVHPVTRKFAGGCDLAVLTSRSDNSALALVLNGGHLTSECRAIAVGYTAAGVERIGHGRIQKQLLAGKESLASLDCDDGMSGCPAVDMQCRVVGMVTGALGQSALKTRVLSHERLLMMVDELETEGIM